MEHRNLLLIGILTVALAVSVNFTIKSPIVNLLGVLFIVFIPGYLLSGLLFNKKFGTLENLVSSIGLSVSLVILVAMITYFAGMEISATNILNFEIVAIFGLIIVNSFIKNPKEAKRKSGNSDRIFYLLLFLTVVVLAVLIYASAFYSPEEEFVELYWSTYKVNDIKNVTQVPCEIKKCGLSGVYRVGNMEIDKERFNVMFTDLDELGKYNVFCIDFNHDGKFCGSDEGPYRYYETFFFHQSAFSLLNLDENQIVFVNYPKYLFVTDFNVSFVVKSISYRRLNYDVTVLVNDTIQYNQVLGLNPEQEIVDMVNITLPTKGNYKVEAIVNPIGVQTGEAYINFWVDRRI